MPNNRGLSTNPNDKAKNFSESLKRLLKELKSFKIIIIISIILAIFFSSKLSSILYVLSLFSLNSGIFKIFFSPKTSISLTIILLNTSKKASYITPVPGGVGPMTIAMLLKNTIRAYELNRKV